MIGGLDKTVCQPYIVDGWRKTMSNTQQLTDLTGEKLASMRVLAGTELSRVLPTSIHKYRKYQCRCECCGKEVEIETSVLTKNSTLCECQRKDYTGQVVEKLTVLEGLDELTWLGAKQKYKRYRCSCECGNEVIATPDQLNRKYKVCRCDMTDFAGQKIGKLNVVKGIGEVNNARSSKYRYLEYECRCDCGKDYTVSATMLARKTRVCHCDEVDLIGKVIGKLEVISGAKAQNNTNNKYTFREYNCRCICGKEYVIAANDLVKETDKCGCDRIDLTGEKFGKLTAIRGIGV